VIKRGRFRKNAFMGSPPRNCRKKKKHLIMGYHIFPTGGVFFYDAPAWDFRREFPGEQLKKNLPIGTDGFFFWTVIGIFSETRSGAKLTGISGSK
jgi:hypothetical protein